MSRHLFNTIERYPIDIEYGSATAALYDTDGNQYLDFWSDEATQALGTDISPLLMEFAELGIPHQLPDIFPNPVRDGAAMMLCEAYGFDRLMFGNGGADSIETAIKLARKWAWAQSKRSAMVYTLSGNFHGRSYGAMGLSDSVGSGSPYHKYGYDWSNPTATSWPGYGVLPADVHEIEAIVNPAETAAIFMAPILGNNVVRAYPLDFYRDLREYCTRNHILLVFDEIQSGSGWTGHYSAAQYFGVQPDVMVLGKRIALGFPMSACLTTDEIAGVMKPGTHFNTFAGSPFVCWMAAKYLHWLNDGGLDVVADKGTYIAAALADELQNVAHINQYGMMIAFQIDYASAGYTGTDLARRTLEKNVIIVTHRERGEIRFTPPLTATIDEIDRAVRAVADAQRELARG